MSYHNNGMGDMFSDMQAELQKQIERACPPSSTYNGMVARADELERTWNPTGFYSWQDMADVVAATVQLAGQASSAAIAFFSGDSLPSSKDRVRAASNKYNAVAKQAIDYTLAWKAAKDAGKPVSAPGFKRWVIDDLRAAAELFRTVEIAVCTKPWWVSSAAAIGRSFNAVVDIAKRIGGVILKVGEGALKAVERTGDIVGFLLGVAPYAAAGIGAYLLYSFVKKKT